MKSVRQMHFKERRPEETAAFLQDILKKLDIAVEEQQMRKSSIDTFSMRVAFTGTDLGCNGKGVSEVYMKASAYAELFERLQNGYLNPWGWYETQEKGYCHCPDEQWLSSRQISEMAEENSFLVHYFSTKGLLETDVQTRAERFEALHRVEAQFQKGKDRYEVRPFYSVRKNRIAYVPYYLCIMQHASNGMCAGNTPYEALVQGFSEIMERHVQKKIMQEKPCLPDVPDSYLQNCPEVWERLEKIREIPGIRAYMKDGSFGGRYPVAVLILICENTGGYGVKLGCHPDFGIAMERTLTEATQGTDLREYCSRSWIDFYNRGVDSEANIYNSYKFGEAQYPCELFGEEPSYPFVPQEDVSDKTNKELFEKLAADFLNRGYDILLRDVSYLGFPSYQMLIPGFSEFQQESDLMAKVYNTRAYLTPYLAYPERMNPKAAKLLRGMLSYWEDSPMENQMKQIYSVYPEGEFPAEDMRKGWQYLSAMCSVMLGEYKEAADQILQILLFARKIQHKKEAFYRGLYEYLTLRDTGKPHEEAMQYLHKFFDASICQEIQERMADEKQIFVKQYRRYDYQQLYGEPKSGECAIWETIRRKLFAEYEKHIPDQLALQKIFADVMKQEWQEE